MQTSWSSADTSNYPGSVVLRGAVVEKWTPLEPFVGPLTEKRRDGHVISHQLTHFLFPVHAPLQLGTGNELQKRRGT